MKDTDLRFFEEFSTSKYPRGPNAGRYYVDVFHQSYLKDVNYLSKCWEWQATRGGKGNFKYGVTYFRLRQYRAHRIAFLLTHQHLTPGKVIMHKCDNPGCVNPEHLEEGTPAANTRDMMNKGRARLQGSANGNSKISIPTLIKIFELRNSGNSYASIADKVKCHVDTVQKIIRGKLRLADTCKIGLVRSKL